MKILLECINRVLKNGSEYYYEKYLMQIITLMKELGKSAKNLFLVLNKYF